MPARLRVQLAVMLPMLVVFGLVRPEVMTAVSLEVVSAGSRDQPVVALTFDDGTDPANTRAIFAILQSAGVAATFFPFGNAMRADPTFWPQVVAAGYPIGNHSMTHPVLTSLSDAALRSEINDATALITQLSGQPPIRFMRPPYGAWDQRVAAAAAAGGYSWLLLWDVDPRDWAGPSAQTIVDRVVSAARDGSVILLHTFPAQTLVALPGIIAGLRARGFGFVTIPQLLGGAPRLRSAPPPPVAYEATVSGPHRPTPGQAFGKPVLVVRGLQFKRASWIHDQVHRRLPEPD
jgi:peptidoglycan/xylan/chitin deacetylase (PgdA/CDA1 family)